MTKHFKRTLVLGISYLLVAALAIGGTVAYLTDRDSVVNVFTVGNVDITLNEDFPDDKLIPGKDLTKEATIKNTGNNNAWVWMTVAIPAALDNPDDAGANILHWNVPGAFWDKYFTNDKYIDSAKDKYTPVGGSYPVPFENTWNVDDLVKVQKGVKFKDDDTLYNVYTLLYNGLLAPDKTTNVGLSNVYFDTKVDVDPTGEIYAVVNEVKQNSVWDLDTDNDGVNDNLPKIIVSAYAIQDDESFTGVLDAYNAYTAQWGVNNGK